MAVPCQQPFWGLSSPFVSFLSSCLLSTFCSVTKTLGTNLCSFGHCSFRFVSLSIWNWLPTALRNKSLLHIFKSHLFSGFFLNGSPCLLCNIYIFVFSLYVYVCVWHCVYAYPYLCICAVQTACVCSFRLGCGYHNCKEHLSGNAAM